MPTVWVISDSGHDYTKAAPLGEVKFVFDGPVNVFASDRLVKEIEAKMVDAQEGDYVLPSGATLANCLIFTLLCLRFGKVSILIYSFKKQNYEVRTIHLNQFKMVNKEEPA